MAEEQILVNITIKQAVYEFQTKPAANLSKIVEVFKANGYLDGSKVIIPCTDNGKQLNLLTTISEVKAQHFRDRKISIKFISNEEVQLNSYQQILNKIIESDAENVEAQLEKVEEKLKPSFNRVSAIMQERNHHEKEIKACLDLLGELLGPDSEAMSLKDKIMQLNKVKDARIAELESLLYKKDEQKEESAKRLKEEVKNKSRLSTKLINGTLFSNTESLLVQKINAYTHKTVRSIQCLFSLRKCNVPYNSLKQFISTIDPAEKVLMLIEVKDTVMAIYANETGKNINSADRGFLCSLSEGWDLTSVRDLPLISLKPISIQVCGCAFMKPEKANQGKVSVKLVFSNAKDSSVKGENVDMEELITKYHGEEVKALEVFVVEFMNEQTGVGNGSAKKDFSSRLLE